MLLVLGSVTSNCLRRHTRENPQTKCGSVSCLFHFLWVFFFLLVSFLKHLSSRNLLAAVTLMFTYRYDLNTATQYLSKDSSVLSFKERMAHSDVRGVQKGWSPAWNLPVVSVAGDSDQV